MARGFNQTEKEPPMSAAIHANGALVLIIAGHSALVGWIWLCLWSEERFDWPQGTGFALSFLPVFVVLWSLMFVAFSQ